MTEPDTHTWEASHTRFPNIWTVPYLVNRAGVGGGGQGVESRNFLMCWDHLEGLLTQSSDSIGVGGSPVTGPSAGPQVMLTSLLMGPRLSSHCSGGGEVSCSTFPFRPSPVQALVTCPSMATTSFTPSCHRQVSPKSQVVGI